MIDAAVARKERPPVTDPLLLSVLEAEPIDPAAILEAAADAMRAERPTAGRAELRAFGAALSYWATDGDPPPGEPINKGLEVWLCRVLDRVDTPDPVAAIALVEP